MKANTTTATAENTVTFEPDTMTMNGQTFPAGYSVTPNGTVYVFVTVQEDGEDVNMRIKITPDDPSYPAALAVAQPAPVAQEEPAPVAQEEPAPVAQEEPAPVAQEEPAPIAQEEPAPVAQEEPAPIAQEEPAPIAQEEPAPIAQEEPAPVAQEEPAPIAQEEPAPVAQEEPAPVAQEEPAPVAQEEPAPVAQEEPASVAQVEEPAPVAQEQEHDAKQARGPVPEKTFVGLEIKGRGWKIVFDGGHERTRVIFKGKPSQAAKDAIAKAGFFWSPALESWNKKLTHKAFRAAQALALELKTICG